MKAGVESRVCVDPCRLRALFSLPAANLNLVTFHCPPPPRGGEPSPRFNLHHSSCVGRLNSAHLVPPDLCTALFDLCRGSPPPLGSTLLGVNQGRPATTAGSALQLTSPPLLVHGHTSISPFPRPFNPILLSISCLCNFRKSLNFLMQFSFTMCFLLK